MTVEDTLDIVAEVGLILGEPTPTQIDKAWELLWRTEKLKFRLSMAYSDALDTLYKRRLQVLLPKDSTVTDLDRTTAQNAGSAEQEANRERLELCMDLVTSRIKLLDEYIAHLVKLQDTKTKEE